MKYVEVINHLTTFEDTENLMAKELPAVDLYQIDVYLEGKLDLQSDLKFFDAETIPNNLVIEVDGIKHINLFPLIMLQEMVEEYKRLPDQKLTDQEIATKILDYRNKDA